MKNKQGPTLFTRILALFAVTLIPLTTAPVSLAATYYWDSDGTAAGNSTSTTTETGLGGPYTTYTPTAAPPATIPVLPTPGIWNTTSALWWDGTSGADVPWVNSLSNTAYFWTANAVVNGNTINGDSVNLVNLGTAITAGAIQVNSGSYGTYIIGNGGNVANTLTLGGNGVAGMISAGPAGFLYSAAKVQIDAQILGDSGLTIGMGAGTVVLTNNNNAYTGFTNINNGTLVIFGQGALGASTSAVIVNAAPTNYGYEGGTLVIGGGAIGGTGNASPGLVPHFTRDLSLSGRGANGSEASGAALITVGSQVIDGKILMANTGESRIISNGGTLTINGTVTLSGGQSPILYGDGNFIINGQITGNQSNGGNGLIKTGNTIATTLVLTNRNNDFSGDLRIDSGTIRVDNGAELGLSLSSTAGIGTPTHVNFNGGTLEVRADAADAGSFADIGIAGRNNTVNIFTGRAVGGSSINQTIDFGSLEMTNGRTYQFTGNDGYNITFDFATPNNGNIASTNTFVNSSNGTLTFNQANFWNMVDTTGSRLLIFGSTTAGQGLGEVHLLGSIVATPSGLTAGSGIADHQFEKTAAGLMTIDGTASTFTGGTFVNNGTLSVSQIGGASGGALNGVAGGVLSLGSNTTTGALIYTGAAGTGAGETTAKAINLGGVTGGGIIMANQAGSGASGLVLLSNVAASSLGVNAATNGGGSKTLYLGGTSASSVINELHGVIVDQQLVGSNFVTNLVKNGSSTWLYTPDAANYVTTQTTAAATSTVGGTAAGTGQANITLTSVAGLAIGQIVTGANVPTGAFITAINAGTNTITINTNITTAVAAGTALSFSAVASTHTTVALTGYNAINSNVIALDSVAGLVVGQAVTGLNVPTGSIITAINASNNTITISNNITTAVGTGVTVSFGQINNFSGNVTISGGTLQIRPSAASGNGSDVIKNTSQIIFNADPLTGNQQAGGTFEYQGFSTGSTETVGSLVVTAGANTVKVTPGASGTSTLVFSNLGAISAGTSVNFITSANGKVQFLAGTTPGFIDSHFYVNGADFAVANASGVISAPVYGGSDPDFSAASGSAFTPNTHNLITSSITADMIFATPIYSLKLQGSDTITLTPTSDFEIYSPNNTGAGIIQTGGQSIIQGGTNLGTNGQELVIRVNGVNDGLTLATLTDASVFGLTKSGAGLLTLVGAQGYQGATTINEGTVKLQNSSGSVFDFTLGSSANNLTIRQGATLELNGAGLTGVTSSGTIVNAAQLSGAGVITNSAAGTLVTLAVSNGTFSGVISGNTALSVTGSNGVLALTGTNTFTGPLTIHSTDTVLVTSIADIGVASALGAGDVANNAGSLVLDNGTLRYIGSDNSQASSGAVIYQMTQTPSVSTNRLFTLLGVGGAIDSSGTYGNDVLAAGVANNAALIFRNTGNIVFGDAGLKTLTLQGTSIGDNEMDIHLVDNGADSLGIVKQGNGLWVLKPSTANTYTGLTEIKAGILRADDGIGLSSSSALSFEGSPNGATGTTTSTATGSGVLETSGTFTRALGPQAGRVAWNGAGGFAASSSPLVVAIGGTASPTQLFWGLANNPSSLLILSSQTALSDVTFMNPIDLLANTATVFVDDNTSTAMDYATMAGVISGTGVNSIFVKTGNGTLYLTAANTYQGSTYVNGGTLVITSFGSSTNSASSSIGAYSSTTSLNLGTGGSGANLIYVGAGETTNRLINLASTTGQIQIDSSGTGALVLTNVVNSGAGAKSLQLRGANTGANMITSNLSNNGANVLTVQKQDGGTWILSGDNTYTGQTIVSTGLLGLTNINPVTGVAHVAGSSSIGTGTLLLSNGGIFAVDGPLTITNPVSFNGNANQSFTGQYAITIQGNVTGTSNGGTWNLQNDIVPDPLNPTAATLTINGDFNPADTTSRTFTITGPGNTTWNGIIKDQGTGKTTLSLSSWGITVLGGSTGPNTYSGGTSINQGTYVLAKVGAFGAAAGTLTMNGGFFSTTVAGGLTGASGISNTVTFSGNPSVFTGTLPIEFTGVVTNSGGNRVIENDINNGTSNGLIFSNTVNLAESGQARTLVITGSGRTLISGVIANGGNASALQYNGSGTLTLSNTETYTLSTTVNSGNVVLTGASGKFATQTSGITLGATGTLTLDNSTTSVNGRLGNSQVILNGGTLAFKTLPAGGSAETDTANLTVNNTVGYITMDGTAGTNTLTFGQIVIANSSSFLDLNINSLGTINQIKATNGTPVAVSSGGATAVVNGIIDRIVVNGTDFATYGANGLAANTSYTSTLTGTTSNVKLTGAASITADQAINSLTINSAGAINVGGAAGNVVTLASGGLLATGGGTITLSIPVIVQQGAPVVYVNAGTTLEITGAQVNNNLAWAKQGGGTLILSSRQWDTSTQSVNDGKIVLNGGINTLFQNQTFNMGPNGILDLNGNSQFLGQVQSQMVVPNITPTGTPISNMAIINSSATEVTLVTSNGNGNFGGTISGNLNFVHAGNSNNTMTLESATSYTGATIINAGTLQLMDAGTLTNTSIVELSYATLAVNDSNTSIGLYDLPNRVNDSASIVFRGGTLTFTGRVYDNSSETFGSMVILGGANTVSANTGGTNTEFSGIITFASLDQGANNPATNGSTVNFTSGNQLGAQQNSGQIFFKTTPTLLPNGALGAWAIANSTDYAAYNPNNGVGAFSTSGFNSYDITFGAGNVTNLQANSAAIMTTLTAPSTTTGLLRLAGNSFSSDISFSSASNVLNLQYGGLMHSNQNPTATIGTTAVRGFLTAGGTATTGNTELIIYNGSATGAGGTTSLTGATTNAVVSGSNILSATSVGSVAVGMLVTGTGIQAGTVVTAIDPVALTVTLSKPATTTSNAGSYTFATVINNATLTGNATNSTTAGSTTLTLTSITGIVPGMLVTGPNIRPGTTVVDVDATTLTVTLSQSAYLTATAGSFVFQPTANITASVTVNSVIEDTKTAMGTGTATVSLVKSGAGTLVLTANNTYTGGTTIDQGTVLLEGSGVVIPNAVDPTKGLVINGGTTGTGVTVTMLFQSGQIGSSNFVTLNGGSTLNLLGDNTLAGIIINNNGNNTTPTLNTFQSNSVVGAASPGTLTLTSLNSITATATNPGTTATINGTIQLAAGTNVFNIGGIHPLSDVAGLTTVNGASQVISYISPTLNINAVLLGAAAGTDVNKTGDGILQFSQQNYFRNLHVIAATPVTPGGPVGGILISNNSERGANGAIISGPLGTGTVTMDNGTVMLIDGTSRTISNNIVFNGNPIFDTTAVQTGVTLTLNGTITLPAGAVTMTVNSPYLTVSMLGATINGGVTSITKSGLGNLLIDPTVAGNVPINILSGTLSLAVDGDGTGNRDRLALGSITMDTSTTPTITIGRAGTTLPYNQAVNKILAPASFTSIAPNGITVTNNNTYGLALSDNTTFTNAITISVANATLSNQIQGLYLNGVLSGTVTTLTKIGNGTLVLGNDSSVTPNTFVGTLDIKAGVLSVSSDTALGDSSNVVLLDNPIATIAVNNGFRATGTFTMNHVIKLNQTNNEIEVAASNPLSTPPAFGGAPTPSTPYILTLTKPFQFATATNTLTKYDAGILEIAADNSGWTGVLTVAQGAVRASSANAFGSSATGNVVVSNIVGAAVQISAGITNARQLNLSSTGISNKGALEGLAGVSAATQSGLITLGNAASIGADSGATLNITGGITMGANGLTFAGDGTININTTAITGTGTITKIGLGTVNVNVANPGFTGSVTVSRGTLDVTGTGTMGASGTLTVQAGGNVIVDDVGTNTSNRFGSNRALSLTGGTLNFLGNASAASTETFGAITLNSGGLNTLNLSVGGVNGQTNLVFTGAMTRNQNTTLLINVSGGSLATVAANGSATLKLTSGVTQAGSGGNGTFNKGVIPYAVVFDGTNYSLAVLDSSATTFVRAIASNEMNTTLGTAGQNILVSGTTSTTGASIAYNSITLNNGVLDINGLTTLTLGSTTVGAILATGTTNVIGGATVGVNGATATGPGLLTTGGSEIVFHVEGATSNLTVDSIIANMSNGLTKDGGGTLLLTQQENYTSTTAVLEGTLKIGTNNAIRFNQNLRLENSGTFDLNGFNQTTAIFLNDLGQPDSSNIEGGRVINSQSATKQSTFATVNDNTARNWAGNIGGGGVSNSNIAWERAGYNNLVVSSVNELSGPVFFAGGTTQLQSDGSLPNVSSITIAYASLQIDNNSGLSDMADRINNSAPITLTGGQLTYVGRVNTASSEVLGDLHLSGGANTVQVNTGNAGTVLSSDLYFNSLASRDAGTTVNFTQGTNSLGVLGNNVRIHFLTAPTLNSSGVIGAWAIAGSSDFATYAADLGVGAVSQQGYRNYDSTFASGNITSVGSTQFFTQALTKTGMLKLSSTLLLDLTFSADNNVLNLEQGGLLHSNNVTVSTIGTSTARGILTAGGTATTGNTELVVYSNATNSTIAGIANGSENGTNVITLGNTSATTLSVGMVVTGPNIAPGTVITAVTNNTTNSVVTLSNPTNATVANASFTFWANTTINSVIADTSTAMNNGGTATVSLVKSGNGVLTLSGANTYTGGTFVDQGTVNLVGAAGTVVIPGDLTINGGSTQTYANVNMIGNSGQIAATSNITINGPGILFTTGNNTFNTLTFNNNGGSPMVLPTGINPAIAAAYATNLSTGTYAVNGYQLGAFVFVNGALTLTGGKITATSNNVDGVSTLAGRADLGAGNVTVVTSPITWNGQSLAPLAATFGFEGLYGSSGGITLTGPGLTANDGGVVAFTAQDTYTGGTHVMDGSTMLIAEMNAGSRFSTVTLDAGTTLNLSGVNTVLGGLAGAGVVTNTGSNLNSILTVGYNNATTTFSGQFNRYNDALPAGVSLTKVGSGELILTGAADLAVNASGVLAGTASTGTLLVQGGQVAYTGNGTGGFATNTVVTGGTLILDNGTGGTAGAGTNVNNRLNSTISPIGAGTLNINGGNFQIYGNSTVATSEQLNTLTIGSGMGSLVLNSTTQALTLTVQNLTGIQAGGTLVLRNLGGAGVMKVTNVNTPGGQGGGAAGTTTMTIRPDIIGDNIATGFDGNLAFVTTVAASGAGLRPLASNEMAALTSSTGAGSSSTNYTMSAATGNDTFLGVNQSANSIRIESGLNILGAMNTNTSAIVSSLYNKSGGYITETINTGGILALSGASNITVGVLAASSNTNTLYFYTETAGTSITVDAFLGANTNLTKSLDGTLTLDKKAFYNGTTTVNGGNLILNGGNNTLLVNATNGAPTLTALALNAGKVDLNGNSQVIGVLNNNNPLPNSGGTITNSSATTKVSLISVNNSTQSFGGVIDGNLDFYKYGNSNLFLNSTETYTGATVIGGAGLFLKDSGILANTTSITAYGASLVIDDSNFTVSGTATPNRIPNVTNITLAGSQFQVTGAGTLDTIMNVQKFTLTNGQNTISLQPAINSGSTVILTIGNLVTSGPEAVVNFNGFVGTRTVNTAGSPVNYGVNTLGQSNLFTASQIFLQNVNGTAFSTANLVNNLIGGWAVANGGSFATYNNTYGVGGLGTDASYANYDGTDITSASTLASWNINDNTTRTLATSKTINSLTTTASATFTLSPSVTLKLNVGFLTNVNGGVTITGDSTTALTGGTGVNDLYVYINQSTTTISTQITDSGTGTMNLVKEGGASLTLAPTAANSFGGSLYVEGGTLNLSAAANVVVVPHDLVIIGSTGTTQVNEVTNAGQLSSSTNITFINNAAFVLPNFSAATTTTLASLTFNNQGGTANPIFNMGTPTALSTLVLTAQNAITSTNDSYAFTPTISSSAATLSALQFSYAGSPIITVNGASPDGLVINFPITSANGAIIKMGTGGLVLSSGASTFTNGFDLRQGTLILGAGSTGSPVTSSPIGTGTLTIEGGTTIMGSTGVTLANAVSVTGDFTFGGALSGNNVTLSGTVNLNNAARAITVTNPLVTATISGAISNGTDLTKNGDGILVLSNAANAYTGATNVNAGILQLNTSTAIPTGTNLTVATGAAVNINNVDVAVAALNGGGLVTNSGAAVHTLTVGSGNTDMVFSGTLAANTAANLKLTKVGTGKLTLASANMIYTGDTTVSAGVLTYTGTGSLAGNLVLSGGNFTGVAGTTFNVGGTMTFNTGSSVSLGVSPVTGLNSTGQLTVSGATTINLFGPITAGTYTLINYTGTALTTTFSNLALGTTPDYAFNYTLTNGVAGDATAVGLIVALKVPPTAVTWRGTVTNVWDTSTVNWVDTATGTHPLSYQDGSDVTFDNSATNKVGGVITVTGTTPVNPNSITVNNSPSGPDSNEYDISAPIDGGLSGGLTKQGSGLLVLSGDNNFGGKVSIQEGAISVQTLNSVSGGAATSNLGAPTTVANGTIDFGGAGTTGTLIITGAGGETTDRVINFAGANGGATIENDASAPETFTSNTTGTGTGTNTFTLQGSNTGANKFNGNIVDTSTGATSVVKAGAGNWVLNGTNNYTGTTTLSSGNLQVGTAGVGQTGTGAFTANGGTLSGTGKIQGAATFNSGSILAPGDSAGAGRGGITFSNGLTMNAGSAMNLDVAAATLKDTAMMSYFAQGTTAFHNYLDSQAATYNAAAVPVDAHDFITVNGNLVLTTGGAINATGTYTGAVGDVIDLLDWTGTLTANGFLTGGSGAGLRSGGTSGDLTLPTLAAGLQYDVSHFLSDGFVVVVPEPSRVLMLIFGAAMLFMRRRRRAE